MHKTGDDNDNAFRLDYCLLPLFVHHSYCCPAYSAMRGQSFQLPSSSCFLNTKSFTRKCCSLCLPTSSCTRSEVVTHDQDKDHRERHVLRISLSLSPSSKLLVSFWELYQAYSGHIACLLRSCFQQQGYYWNLDHRCSFRRRKISWNSTHTKTDIKEEQRTLCLKRMR